MSHLALRVPDTAVNTANDHAPVLAVKSDSNAHVASGVAISMGRAAKATSSARREFDELETELLASLDVEHDVSQLVPMPPSVPVPLRRALTERFAHALEYMEDLHQWLHDAHPELDGDCPFERLVLGDGWSVLRVLRSV